MSNPTQLLLLADHIKLSLLEWQRAKSLDLEPNSQEGEISRSLESLRLGIEAADKKQIEGDEEAKNEYKEQITDLRTQYDDLVAQFASSSTGAEAVTSTSSPKPAATARATLPSSIDHTSPDPLGVAATDFHADETEDPPQHIINSTTTIRQPKPQHPKSVRFTDASREQDFDFAGDDAARAALFPYRDDPSSGASSPPGYDHSQLSNPEVLLAQQQIVRDQDDQLDRLGESIGRQHQLSIQIGDELEGQVQLLDDVDRHVDRNQSRMDTARQRLGRIRRGSGNDRRGMCAIVVLIVILVVLIIILK